MKLLILLSLFSTGTYAVTDLNVLVDELMHEKEAGLLSNTIEFENVERTMHDCLVKDNSGNLRARVSGCFKKSGGAAWYPPHTRYLTIYEPNGQFVKMNIETSNIIGCNTYACKYPKPGIGTDFIINANGKIYFGKGDHVSAVYGIDSYTSYVERFRSESMQQVINFVDEVRHASEATNPISTTNIIR